VRKYALALGLVRAIVLFLVLALFPTAVTAEAKTTVTHYTPFAGNGSLKPSLQRLNRSGDCESSSFVDPARTDAWRCFSGNFIRDPCFESPVVEDRVVCVTAPWARRAVVVDTSLDPSLRKDDPTVQVWAVKLARRRCRFVSGATNVVHGRRLNYVCGPNGPFLFGRPDRRHPTWTILMARDYKGHGLHRVRIRKAWR
jgi:hypothetical protein